MVTLTSAEDALKTLYLGVVSEQLNTGVNPLLAHIQQTSSDVWGKEIVKLAPYGINGGIGAGTEDGTLPTAAENNYVKFTLTLKNLYGTIELSDKAIRASENSAGAFVNLLNAEMEGLLSASKFNFGRMLYGDGTGKLSTVVTNASNSATILYLDDVKNIVEGMVVDIYSAANVIVATGKRISAVDRAVKSIIIMNIGSTPADDSYLVVQGSKGNELTGLKSIFASSGDLYGLSKTTYPWLVPYSKALSSDLTLSDIQSSIDRIEEISSGAVDFIVSSFDVRRVYLELLNTNRRNIDYMNLDGGFKAISYNGVPFIADRFVETGACYLLNSADFKLHQLCDWRWLEGEDGKILRQKAGTPTYTATLVKYADLICDRPSGQAKITNIVG